MWGDGIILEHWDPFYIKTFQGHPHLTNLDAVRYLVLDEADRMIEFGHYQELSSILERVNMATGVGGRGGKEKEKGLGRSGERERQTFVFSATLTLPRRSVEKKVKVQQRKNLSGQESIGEWSLWDVSS